MLISYSHRFLFAHIPKTAGTSIHCALQPYAHYPTTYLVNQLLERIGIRVNLVIGPHTWKRFRLHTEMATVQRVLPREVFDSLFKFAFVRNPWDLLVSRYHFLLDQPRHGHHRHAKRLGSFPAFVRWHAARSNETQWRRIADRHGSLLVDFVGRFESLREDFAKVQARVGIDRKPLAHDNATHREDYRTYYDDETAAFVASRWKLDVEGFGYSFDDPARQLAS